jgi:hypothetical protein
MLEHGKGTEQNISTIPLNSTIPSRIHPTSSTLLITAKYSNFVSIKEHEIRDASQTHRHI